MLAGVPVAVERIAEVIEVVVVEQGRIGRGHGLLQGFLLFLQRGGSLFLFRLAEGRSQLVPLGRDVGGELKDIVMILGNWIICQQRGGPRQGHRAERGQENPRQGGVH